MTTLFTRVLDGITENNEINDGSWADWDGASHAIEAYENGLEKDTDTEELTATKKALGMIIDSNGNKYDEAVREWNMAVWGVDFNKPYSG